MSWKIIKLQTDVDYLNDIFDNFHDSYLKELCFSTGSYINLDHSMNENNDPIARLLCSTKMGKPICY